MYAPHLMRECLNPFRSGRYLSTEFNLPNGMNVPVSIPFDQGDVFRRASLASNEIHELSQSLSSRAMSFDITMSIRSLLSTTSQSLSIRAMSFDALNVLNLKGTVRSQSLSSGAMSFDVRIQKLRMKLEESQSLSSRAMSFDICSYDKRRSSDCLNPFRAGRCLSTVRLNSLVALTSLNPFRAGRCLSTESLWRG